MTLCIAWIRQIDESKELVFATDSCLTGGEKWNAGIKLFELPRKDCLLCFAGSTLRAYPLILNLVSSMNTNNRLSDPRTDIHEVRDHLTELFSDLVNDIIGETNYQNPNELKADAEFIFGGWSWEKQQFCIWYLNYSEDAGGFIFADHVKDPSRSYAIIGTKDILQDAETLFKRELDRNGKLLSGFFDMEPLKILAMMAREQSYRTVDGALQVAKVYKSGTSEFFGVLWRDQYTFLGRKVKRFNRPSVRYIDPDISEIIEEQLPLYMGEVNSTLFGDDLDFIQGCYPKGKLRDGLSNQEKERLHTILRDVAYRIFVDRNESQLDLAEEVAGKNE